MRAILVTGSRDWTDRIAIMEKLDSLWKDGERTILIHGDCRGADRIAGSIADGIRNWSVVPMPAQWKTVGQMAGPFRNRHMLDVLMALKLCGYDCLVLAFPLPGSKGTRHMIRIAHGVGFDVWVYEE